MNQTVSIRYEVPEESFAAWAETMRIYSKHPFGAIVVGFELHDDEEGEDDTDATP